MALYVHVDGIRPYQGKLAGRGLHSIIDGPSAGPQKRCIILKYGAGKTWVSLMIADAARHRTQQSAGTMFGIVLCRKHNVQTWIDEVRQRSSLEPISFDEYRRLSTAKRLKPGQERPKITNRTVIIAHHYEAGAYTNELVGLITASRPFVLICDESTKIKTPSTQRTKGAIRLAEVHEDALGTHGLRMTLTGHMTPEGPHELWSQFQFAFAKRNPFGSSYYQFQRQWFVLSDMGYRLKSELAQKFRDLAAQHILRMTPDEWSGYVTDLGITPTYVTVKYSPSQDQRSLIGRLFDSWSLPATWGDGDEGQDELYNHTISLHVKAQQIANGFYYTEGKVVNRLPGTNPKIEALNSTLQDLFEEKRNRKVIIWCHYDPDYTIVGEMLGNAKIGWCRGPDVEQFRRFRDDPMTQVILMPITISEGFNELAIADVAIYYTNVYSNETRNQAEARIDRMNQKSPITTHIDIIGDSAFDEHVLQCLRAKNLNKSELMAAAVKFELQRKCAV
jgi:hypothetical protein